MKSINLVLAFLFLIPIGLQAQDDLMDLLDKEDDKIRNYTMSTFEGTRIINGHSIETRGKKELEFMITHRFGTVNDGLYDLFGLDEANIRLALEYGITDDLEIGIGRSSFEKTYDGFIKWKFIKQQSGLKNIPVSVTAFGSTAINTLRYPSEMMVEFDDRLSYVAEILIARKFGQKFALQLMPVWVHINTVPENADPNDIGALGIASKYKITPSVSLTFEYYYRFNQWESIQSFNPIGFGVDIETGGHVFQLHITNSRTTFERAFLTQTTDDFWNGDIRFGFNISRTFQLGKKEKKDWD